MGEQFPNPAGPPLPDGAEALWTPRRREIHGWLRESAPSLAELYEGAVRLTYAAQLPGRVRFIAHAVREIRNALPAVMSDAVRRGPLDYAKELDQLASAWRDYGPGTDGMLPNLASDAGETAPPPDVSLPRPLVHRIAGLLSEHQAARGKKREAAVHLFEACVPRDQFTGEFAATVIDQWIDVTDWFMGKAHDSGAPDAAYETALPGQFESFETILGNLARAHTRDFFATLEEIDAILEDANT